MDDTTVREELDGAITRLNRRLQQMEEKLDKILAMLEPLMHPPMIVEHHWTDEEKAVFQKSIEEYRFEPNKRE